MNLRALAAHFSLAAFLFSALSATPPPGFDEIDQEVEIRALSGTMTFDLPAFTVKPGARVKLVLINEDGMQHNLVICEPVEEVERLVGEAALALGAAAPEKQFVPDMPEVLFHTRVVGPGEEDILYFEAPLNQGGYPYVCTLPGHWFTMKGVMQVSEGPPGYLRDLTVSYYAGVMESVFEMDEREALHTKAVPDAVFDIEAHDTPAGHPFGLRYRGDLELPKEGDYNFWITSDDGVRLSVGGHEVILDDGPHAPRLSSGTIHLAAGRHPVELRYFDSGGDRALVVHFSGPGLTRTALTPPASQPSDPRFRLAVGDQPRVMRLLLPDASTDAIAVGLPNGVSYCFDVSDSSVRYGWNGGFLDITPHMRGRGGQVCELLGERFDVGHVHFPLRIGSNDTPAVTFLGYRRGQFPSFDFSVDGIEVTQTVRPAENFRGLVYDFELRGEISDPVRFLVDRRNLLVEGSAGEWTEEGLLIPAAHASRFRISVGPGTTARTRSEGTHSGHSH